MDFKDFNHFKATKIKESTLEDILEASRNTYPNEFMALLGGDKKAGVVDEIVIVPATYGREHAIIHTNQVPMDFRIMGSVHSHPSPNAFPSKGDLRTFPRLGEIHFIIAYPFDLNSTRAFDSAGNEIEFEVIE